MKKKYVKLKLFNLQWFGLIYNNTFGFREKRKAREIGRNSNTYLTTVTFLLLSSFVSEKGLLIRFLKQFFGPFQFIKLERNEKPGKLEEIQILI